MGATNFQWYESNERIIINYDERPEMYFINQIDENIDNLLGYFTNKKFDTYFSKGDVNLNINTYGQTRTNRIEVCRLEYFKEYSKFDIGLTVFVFIEAGYNQDYNLDFAFDFNCDGYSIDYNYQEDELECFEVYRIRSTCASQKMINYKERLVFDKFNRWIKKSYKLLNPIFEQIKKDYNG